MSRNIRHVPTGREHTFKHLFLALICYILNFFKFVAENTPANHHPLATIFTPVDQRLQSHVQTLL